MNAEFALWMFPVLLGAIFIGVPVAYALMSVALLFGIPTFGPSLVVMFAQRVEEVSSSHLLAAVPLFIFMGAMLEKSGIAEGMFEEIGHWTRRLPGGIAIATIVICVLFAASSGVVGATETVVGLLAVPVMMRHGYDKGLISGTICAGGSLGFADPENPLSFGYAMHQMHAGGAGGDPRWWGLIGSMYDAIGQSFTPPSGQGRGTSVG